MEIGGEFRRTPRQEAAAELQRLFSQGLLARVDPPQSRFHAIPAPIRFG